MAPTAQRAAVEGAVQFAFKAVQDIGDVAETGGLQRVASVYGAFATAANQVDRALFGLGAATCLARYGQGKLRRIGVQIRVLVPRNVLYPGRTAHVQGLDFHTHIEEKCVGGVLYFLPGGAGF